MTREQMIERVRTLVLNGRYDYGANAYALKRDEVEGFAQAVVDALLPGTFQQPPPHHHVWVDITKVGDLPGSRSICAECGDMQELR